MQAEKGCSCLIFCDNECIYAKNGECVRTDIVIGLSGCHNCVDVFDSTCRKVIEHFGRESQINKACEEFEELMQAIKGNGDVLEELADALNMIRQLVIMKAFNNSEVSKIMADKMKRTLERMEQK